MKKDNFKKVAILSTAFALSASLLSFGPVSFKVLPQNSVAYAASADELKSTAKNVLATVNSDSVLKPAYEAARTEAINTIDVLHISEALPNLNATNVSPDKKAAIKALINEVIAYTQASDVAFDKSVITNLNTQFGTNVTAEDTAVLLSDVQDVIIAELKTQTANFADFDLDLLSSILIDALKEEFNTQWGSSSNSLVLGVESIYGSANKQNLLDDLSSLKAAIAANANKSVLKKGSAALAIGYAKYYIANNEAAIEIETVGNTKSIKKVSVEGVTIPLSLLTWSDSSNNTSYNVDTNRVVFDYSSFSTSGTANIQGKLGNLFNSYGFTGVVLVDTTVNYTIGSSFTGGSVVDSNNAVITLPTVNSNAVNSSEALAQVASKTIKNNTEALKIAEEINKLVDVSVKLQVPAGTKVESGKPVNLSVSDASFTEDFLNSFAKLIKDVEQRADGKVDVTPNISLDATELSNVTVDLPASLINKLVGIGVSTVTLKTADGEIVLPISKTSTNVKITVEAKEEPKDVVYTTPGGTQVTLTPGYSSVVTLTGAFNINTKVSFTLVGEKVGPANVASVNSSTPVVAAATSTVVDKSKLTIAKVTDDNKVTLISSKYNEKTGQVEGYITEPGSYVVVEVDANFTDNKLAWASDAIKNGARQGIFQGRGNNEFQPKAGVTQAEYLTILLRTFNLTAGKDAGKNVQFSDVNATQWFYNSVAAGLEHRIISQGTGKFEPNKVLTREEMAYLTANVLVNVLGFEDKYPTTNAFTVDGHLINEKYVSSVRFVTNEEIFNGRAEGVFDPKGTVTRAEAAVVALRLHNIR